MFLELLMQVEQEHDVYYRACINAIVTVLVEECLVLDEAEIDRLANKLYNNPNTFKTLHALAKKSVDEVKHELLETTYACDYCGDKDYLHNFLSTVAKDGSRKRACSNCTKDENRFRFTFNKNKNEYIYEEV